MSPFQGSGGGGGGGIEPGGPGTRVGGNGGGGILGVARSLCSGARVSEKVVTLG